MSVTWLRDTTGYMAGVGVALRFHQRIERERVARGWSASRLSAETARFTPAGKPIPRSTIDNLKVSTRAPQPYIVAALASALDIDHDEANVLAGLLPPPSGASDFERYLASLGLDEDQAQIIKAVHDQVLAANRARPTSRRRATRRADDERPAI